MKHPAYQLVFTRSGLVAPDGTFSVPAVLEGRYRVAGVAGLGPDLYLADVRQGAMSVFDLGFNVSARSNDPIQVVIGSGAGTVEGVVRESPLKGFPGANVVLVPEASRALRTLLFTSPLPAMLPGGSSFVVYRLATTNCLRGKASAPSPTRTRHFLRNTKNRAGLSMSARVELPTQI